MYAALVTAPRHSCLACLLLLATSLLSTSQAQEVVTACPSAAELQQQLAQRLSQLTDTRDRLSAFISGDQLADVPPASLFVVEMSNEAAVATRVAELAAESQVNALRLQFLSLPSEQRATLVNAQRSFVEQSEAAKALEQERIQAKELKQQAQQSVAVAEEMAKSAVSSSMRELASHAPCWRRPVAIWQIPIST